MIQLEKKLIFYIKLKITPGVSWHNCFLKLYDSHEIGQL